MFATWHRRYWLGGATLAILLVVALVMNAWLPTQKRVDQRIMGLDFVAFYTAGDFVRTGQSDELYNLAAIKKFQQELANRNNLELKNIAAWWNPPVYALIFAPLSALNFRTAYWIWLGINLACLGGAIWLLIKLLPARTPWRYRGLVPLLICVSMPAIQAMGHAQNSAISLLILAGAVSLAIKDRPMLAGLVSGLLLYKPQIALAVGLILGLCANWRLWIGFAITASVVLAINLLALPGTLGQYIGHVGANLHAVQFGQTYIWERQTTLAGFWRLLLQGRAAAERSTAVLALTLISQIALIAGLALAWFGLTRSSGVPGEGGDILENPKSEKRNPKQIPNSNFEISNGRFGFSFWRLWICFGFRFSDFGFSFIPSHGPPRRGNETCSIAWMIAALTAMPLLLPYFLDYDLLLLAVPATLFARQAIANPPRIGAALWTALYLCLLVNPGLGRLTHINLAVPLLCVVAMAMMAVARRKEIAVSPEMPGAQNDLRLAA